MKACTIKRLMILKNHEYNIKHVENPVGSHRERFEHCITSHSLLDSK